MKNRLTIMFAPMDSIGHTNACIAVAQALSDCGHDIVFAAEKSWQTKLEKFGFREELYTVDISAGEEDVGVFWANFMAKFEGNVGLPSLEQALANGTESTTMACDFAKSSNDQMEVIIRHTKPDVIVVDHYASTPAIINSGIPWVFLVSANPVAFIEDERTPPIRSGYPMNDDRKNWVHFREEIDKLFNPAWNEFNKWIVERGSPALPVGEFIHHSPYLNIYAYPKEIDYTDVRPLPKNWHQFDGFYRNVEENFEIPESFISKPGKLIYFSMGSLGTSFLKLMTRLIAILAKSPNKFIVSKGPQHEKLEFADNMWGQRFLPQTKVLPLVDLVITHGGNNTVCESLYFGKPMIVLPLFYDQLNNAQRISEKGLGERLNVVHCTESELLSSIERLLNDQQLENRLKAISKRIQASDSMHKAVQLIENLVYLAVQLI